MVLKIGHRGLKGYGNENKLDEEPVIKYLKDLETFKEEIQTN